MKDMGKANANLKIELTRTLNYIELSQEYYTEKVLNKFRYYAKNP